MSSSRHRETDGLTECVNNTFQQLLRCFSSYDGNDWTDFLHQVEFAYNASRALGFQHTTLEANFGFFSEELFIMRPSIPVSQDASERLKLLQEVHAMVRHVLRLHKDDMQARTNRRQPHTSSEETRCQLSPRASSYVDRQTRS
jgi:hypothetical protein